MTEKRLDTLHLVAPGYREAARRFPMFDYDPDRMAPIREGLLKAYAECYGDPASFAREELELPGLAGAPPVRALLYRPKQTQGPIAAILHVHGGGWVAGSADMLAGFCSALARERGVLVLSVDYRLAPETAEPGPMDDCYAALAWLHDNADVLGVDHDRIAVLGDSAGGGLAAGIALRSRDEGSYPLKAQFLIYPGLDARTGTDEAPTENPTTGQFVISRPYLRQIMAARLGNVELDPAQRSYFSPVQAENLAGVAPAFIAVGSLDLFLDEDVTYAMRLSHAAVGVELHVYADVFHGFDLIPGDITDQFSNDLAQAIDRML